MDILKFNNSTNFGLLWTASLLIHYLLLLSFGHISRPEPSKSYKRVEVRITSKPTPVTEPPKAEAKPPKAKKLSKKIAPMTKAPALEPVLGLSRDSFATSGSGNFNVPAGNTTMTEDRGKRLAPEDIQKLDRDLSEDAKLISGTFIKPEYTAEAEEKGLEGSFLIDVYVDTEGRVTEAELRRKVGFGMDKRLLEAARRSRFTPRKNPLGQTLAGWTELKIRLTLE